MDLDPVGADISDESQLTLHPASGLDPTRQVKYIPAAATSIYPNVTQPLFASVSTEENVEPRTVRPLQVVPVVGQNVAQAPVDLRPPEPVKLAQQAPSAPIGPQPYQPEQPQKTPGIGQGLFGSNRTVVQPYRQGADSQEIAKENLRGQAQREESFAFDPLKQLFFKSKTDEALKSSIEKRLKIDEIEKAQQQQRDIDARAINSGLPPTYKGTDNTIVEGLVAKMKSGDPVAAVQASEVLKARGHNDLVVGYQPEMVAAIEGTLLARNKLQQQLDNAKTDKDYNEVRDKLEKGKQDPGFNIPKSLGEWEKQRGPRDDAFRRAMVLVDRLKTERANQSDYTLTQNKDAAEINKKNATLPNGVPMYAAEGVDHKGNLSVGGRTPTGSHILTDYGKTWSNFTPQAQKDFHENLEKTFTKPEQSKYIGLMRINEGATHDAKGNLLPPDKINTNPVMLQALAEVMTAEFREGAGGANASMMNLELANRGWVQNKIDTMVKNFAGLKGVVTGKEGEYLTGLSEKQKRDVLDFMVRHTTASTGARVSGAVENAGIAGAKPGELGLEPELLNAPGVQAALARGRDRAVEHMGNSWRVVGDDHSTFLGLGNAAANVPGAVRTPVPATRLPGLYPELAIPPPAAATAPGGGGGPPSGTTLPSPQPGGGAPRVVYPGGPVPSAPGGGGGGGIVSPAGAAPIPPGRPGGPGGPGGGPAPIAPTVPTPQAPGGPGTSVQPPSAPAPSGQRAGGTFTQGVPSGGFPAHINSNNVARTVYSVAGQTGQNVNNNPVIGTNSAIVATSSAQSESAFNPNESHDNKTGYGLFGHRLDRLTAMHAFAGTKPGEPIPPNVQTAFFVREMSRAADSDPFIAQTLANPNASAEDLTRVQMRMEQPKGYKRGAEEQAPSWNARLANTKALMAGQPAATAVAQPAAAVVAAPQPTTSLLNPRVALQSIQQKAAQVPAKEVFQNAPNMAPAVLGTGGAIIGGAAAGPPGAVIGGATGGVIGGGIKNYFTGAPEQQTPAGYLKEGVFGGAQGAVAGIPGVGVAATAARVGLSGAIPGFEKYVEGKSAGEIYDATGWGLLGGAVGEGFGRALGAAGNALWGGYNKATQAELVSVGKTLAQEQPKIIDQATGKLVENAVYTKAVDRAKQLHQDPDNLAHAWNSTEGAVARGQIPVSKGEALSQRPGQVAQVKAGQQLEEIKQEIGAAPKPVGLAARPQFVHDPVAMVGSPEVPAKFMSDAVTARDLMNKKAGSWGEVWGNVTQARTNLLVKQREAMAIKGPGRQEAMDAYRAMADEVRNQQQHIAERLLPKAQSDALMQRLEVASNNYRKAILAGGDDIVKTIAKGGPKGRETQAAIKELVGNDPQAETMLNALIRLHNKGREGVKIGGGGAAAYIGLAHVPVIGQAVAAAGAGYSAVTTLKLLNALWAARGAGAQVKFADLARQVMSKTRHGQLRSAGAVLGGAAGLPVAQAVGAAQ